MPPRPSRATIRYRSTRIVPGENPPPRRGCELGGTGVGAAAALSGSRVGVSRMAMTRPHEEQKRTFSEHTAPQPEQVIMRTHCIAPPGEAAKVCGSDSTQQLGNGVRIRYDSLSISARRRLRADDGLGSN